MYYFESAQHQVNISRTSVYFFVIQFTVPLLLVRVTYRYPWTLVVHLLIFCHVYMACVPFLSDILRGASFTHKAFSLSFGCQKRADPIDLPVSGYPVRVAMPPSGTTAVESLHQQLKAEWAKNDNRNLVACKRLLSEVNEILLNEQLSAAGHKNLLHIQGECQ